MDLASKQSWFAAQPEPFKILVLLEVLYQLTIDDARISTEVDTDLKWEAAWQASECHHRVLEYVRALLFRSDHNYPDDVIIEIVDYKLESLGSGALHPFGLGSRRRSRIQVRRAPPALNEHRRLGQAKRRPNTRYSCPAHRLDPSHWSCVGSSLSLDPTYT